ncbi:MAG: hypothetical protein IJ200_04390 [Prevotella sp.]|nr:hypothetical protein [Prevotella sp.]
MINRWNWGIIFLIVFPVFFACEFRPSQKLKKDSVKTELKTQRKRTKLPLSLFDGNSIKDYHTTNNKIIRIGEYPFVVDIDSIQDKTGSIRLVYKYRFVLQPVSDKNRRVAIKTPEKGAQDCLPKVLCHLENKLGKADEYTFSKLQHFDTLCIGAHWFYRDGAISVSIIPSDVAKQDSIGNMVYMSDIVISIKKKNPT